MDAIYTGETEDQATRSSFRQSLPLHCEVLFKRIGSDACTNESNSASPCIRHVFGGHKKSFIDWIVVLDVLDDLMRASGFSG